MNIKEVLQQAKKIKFLKDNKEAKEVADIVVSEALEPITRNIEVNIKKNQVEHREIINKIDKEISEVKEDLENKIENIELTPGEKGEKGEQGNPGLDGKDGYTPIKGNDYFDGEKGDKGDSGKDGIDGKNGLDGKDGNDGSSDTPQQVADKINTLEDVIEPKVIKGLNKRLSVVDKNISEVKRMGGGGIGGPNNAIADNVVFWDSQRNRIKDSGLTLSGSNTGDQIASTVPNTPAGNIASTDVQGALNELDTEKVSKAELSVDGGCSLVGIDILGTPTYTTQCDFNKLFGSAGRASGGAITDAGSETVNVAVGTGFIKATDSDTAELLSFNWSASAGLSVPTDTVRYIGVEYNGGSPQVVISATQDWDYDTEFPLGSVINQAGTLYIMNDYWWVTDGITNIIERFQSEGTVRDNKVGGLIIGTSTANTTRKPTLTAGTVWSRLNEFDITAKDCSGTDTFYGFYRDGGTGWTRTAAKTDIDDFYDNNSGTLQALSANKYVNFWLFAEIDTTNGGQLMVIYPQNQYNTSAVAENEDVPVFPSIWYKHGVFLGKIMIKQGVTAPVEVASAFSTIFSATLAADHANLSNLTWTSSNHTGTANKLVGFNASGDATEYGGATPLLVDVRGKNFINTQSCTIGRNADGYITTKVYTGGLTWTFTRDANNIITSYTDGTNVWTPTRNANNFITAIPVT